MYRVVLRSIAYVNSSDAPPASVQINWTFNDGNTGSQGSCGPLSVTGNTTVTIIPVNDAPILGNGTLASLAEDPASPAGQTVSTIFTGQFADIDAGSSFSGIAVVGNTANAGTQGTWQYSTNGGSNWSPPISGTVNDIFEVYFPATDTGYAVGWLGTALKTTDGGTNWTALTSGTTLQLNSVHFTDVNTGSVSARTFPTTPCCR